MVVVIFGLICLGFGYALGAAAIWPSFGLIVEQKYLAMTLGVWGSLDNAFQASMSLVVGVLAKDYSTEERQELNDQYDDARYLWIGLSIGMIVWTLLLWIVDAKKYDNVLWGKSDAFAGKRLGDLCCSCKRDREKDEEIPVQMKKEYETDEKTHDVGIETIGHEDETLVGGGDDDQVFGVRGYTAYD